MADNSSVSATSTNQKPRVCFFGIYDPSYARSKVLIIGFRDNGFEVVECRADPRRHRHIKKYIELIRQYRKIRHTKLGFTHIIVAFPGQTLVWLARLLFGKNIIFDAFLSLYDSNVYDRKLYGSRSLRGFRDFFIDWSSCMLARKVLLDTDQHVDYFVRTFHISRDKFVRVWIGADEDIFNPITATSQREDRGEGNVHSGVFTVHFHGNYIPLQGIEYIVQAADILRNEGVVFNIVGAGQDFEKIKTLVAERRLEDVVRLLGKKPITDIPALVIEADVCLGIFGNTDKTMRVIPNKLFECVALGTPVITAKTPAVSEIFEDKQSIFFCQVANAHSLADTIRFVKDHPDQAALVAKRGRELFVRHFTTRALVESLLKNL